ncbi:NUDIX hydrolase domain-like protein [Thelephora terrestris]|uniref:NUDIX hydrolase domain-like protein n=1 Tax=Thelephora terrestris TaxID=56493 RepID=A0A9P6HFI5_9AGAM|nr:NUDIX hydrolase domain-like protein [Thelephora terrestris]
MITLQDPPSIDQLSERSTPAVPNSVFHATDFLLGAGAVIIQPATGKVVLVTDKRERWFLPKGRKDKGESLEQTVLREAYEETGYRIQFLPLYTGSLAPDPRLPSKESLPVKDTEPIAVTTFNWPEGHPHLGRFGGGEYFTTWFVGQIAEDAVPDTGTGTPSEASFVARLCTIEEALERLKPREAHRRIVEIAWKAWRYTLDVDSGRVPLSARGVPPASCTRA